MIRFFWAEENAEAMSVLRGLVLSRWWRDVFTKIAESLASDRRLDWQWSSPDMVAELNADIATTPPQAQAQSDEASSTQLHSPF